MLKRFSMSIPLHKSIFYMCQKTESLPKKPSLSCGWSGCNGISQLLWHISGREARHRPFPTEREAQVYVRRFRFYLALLYQYIQFTVCTYILKRTVNVLRFGNCTMYSIFCGNSRSSTGNVSVNCSVLLHSVLFFLSCFVCTV